jgi:hypothetical protein
VETELILDSIPASQESKPQKFGLSEQIYQVGNGTLGEVNCFKTAAER